MHFLFVLLLHKLLKIHWYVLLMNQLHHHNHLFLSFHLIKLQYLLELVFYELHFPLVLLLLKHLFPYVWLHSHHDKFLLLVQLLTQFDFHKNYSLLLLHWLIFFVAIYLVRFLLLFFLGLHIL